MMKKTAFWTATAGAAMLAACGQPEIENSGAANNVAEAAPANAAIPSDDGNVSEPANLSAAEGAVPAPRAAPTPEPRPAPTPRREIMPVERRVDRPAPPEREPSPAPATTCTPEHEAMGHCKQ